MKKNSLFKSLFFAAVLVVLPAATSTSQLKVGYVNSETILKELPEAKEAQQQLETTVKKWQDELEKMVKDYQTKEDDYRKKQSLMQPSAKEEEEKKLLDEQQKIQMYRQDKFGTQGELAMQREKMMKPVQEKVFKAIEQIAKEQKLSFVFDKATDVPLLYADPSFDYTFKVIDLLKRGSK